jgi:hypothetical protein
MKLAQRAGRLGAERELEARRILDRRRAGEIAGAPQSGDGKHHSG